MPQRPRARRSPGGGNARAFASFLSPTNTRDDGYGGTPEGRLRLPLEVIAAVRERVGNAYVVGARFLGDEVIAGGGRVDDACRHGVAFARAGLDFLSLSKGGKFDDIAKMFHALYEVAAEMMGDDADWGLMGIDE